MPIKVDTSLLSKPKNSVLHLIFWTSLVCLLLVLFTKIPSLVFYKEELVIIFSILLIFHSVFWLLLFELVSKKISSGLKPWLILLPVCIYVALYALAAFYSDIIFIPLLFISIIVVFDNWYILYFTGVLMLLTNISFALNLLSIPFTADIGRNLSLINIVFGMIATIASFQIKERELELTHLKSISEVKNTFIGAISHNLRTPITAIAGYTEILKKSKNLNSDQSEMLKNIGVNVAELSNLVEDTINITTLESGVFKLNYTAFSLKELLSELVDVNFDTLAKNKNLKLIKSNFDQSDIEITADRERLKIALSNLIDNSIKYTNQGQIEVGFKDLKNQVEVNIKDTGIGISEADLKDLFQEFYRPQSLQKFKQKGSGLGLYISKLIIEELGGTIKVESKLGEGTEFKVTIPKTSPKDLKNVK